MTHSKVTSCLIHSDRVMTRLADSYLKCWQVDEVLARCGHCNETRFRAVREPQTAGCMKASYDFDPNSSNSLRSFTGVAAAARCRLAFHALTFSTLTGMFARDAEGACPLTGRTSSSARNAEAAASFSAAALSFAATEGPSFACAIRCTDSFARVGEDGWIYRLKNSSMSFFVSGSMFSTSR